jgi:hypothetical protein
VDNEAVFVGRVLRSSTAGFSIGCTGLISQQDQLIPEFGALVKAPMGNADVTYGLIQNVTIEDDAFMRQLVAAGIDDEEKIEDQRQNRLMPIVVDVLTIGYGRGLAVAHRLPPQPPGTLDRIYACNNAETVRFSERNDWLRIVLAAAGPAADQLIPTALGRAAAARPPDQREAYLLAAGRELTRLLAMDLLRLDGVLRQLQVTAQW